MADTDLDVLIRKLAKQQHKTLAAAVKTQRDRYAALAARAKDADGRQRYRQLAKDTLEIGIAALKRLQMSADNTADSYARALRQAVEAAAPAKTAAPAKSGPKTSKAVKASKAPKTPKAAKTPKT